MGRFGRILLLAPISCIGRSNAVSRSMGDKKSSGISARVCLRVTIGIWVALVPPVCGFAASDTEAGGTSVSASRRFAFDIPDQPLASALEAYSSVTGIETLYDSAVARERRSAAVHGNFTAADALRMMLMGTSLSARLIAPDAVTIELSQRPAQAAAGSSPDQNAHQIYFGLIQAGLERAFCKDSQVRPGGYRAVLKFRIAANGQIREPSVVGTTGDDERDRMILRTLDGLSLGNSPPAGLQQPIMMVILPQSSGTVLNCASIH
jgi:hypothetical protein